MKVGKEDEKSMRPMFPRVHVNDTEKGGPRAPPRNKMALYEQLSIPLQKFNTAKAGSAAPSATSMQVGTNERTAHSPFYLPHSMPSSSAEKSCLRSSDEKSNTMWGNGFERSDGCMDYKISRAVESVTEGSAFNVHDFTSGTSSFKAKYDDDNDDFRVPSLAQSEVAPHSKDAPLVEVNKPASFGATNVHNNSTIYSSTRVLSSSAKSINEANASGPENLSRKFESIRPEQESRETILSKDHGYEFPNSSKAAEIFAGPSKISSESSDRAADTNINFLNKTNNHRIRMGNEPSHDDSVENRNAKISCSGASFRYSERSYDDKVNGSGELKDDEKSGDVSEVSMIDSISVLDISPDDVVGIIGPKQFWKARRAIVNQQRVFAIQVFELHRLIKVQKLFAESPQLLLDDPDTITIQPKAKNLPVASSLKYPQVVQQRDCSTQKPSQNADLLVEKTAAPPLQAQEKDPNKELCQLPRKVPLAANYHPISMAPDRPNPWCFQPSPNQWLIPVMSPSEGLIYKPYAGPCPPPPGFMAPLYGGCAPLNMPSVAGDFMNSTYGFPSCHQQQSRILPGTPALGPNYFPSPYAAPMVNPVISSSAVEQVSPLTNVRSNGRSVQCSQSSCNISVTKSEALSCHPPKNKPSCKDNELQASSASSPCHEAQGRDLLPVSPLPPATEGSCQASQSSGKENRTHVIKVIPHNARSASESAARIFRSIQRERRQLDL